MRPDSPIAGLPVAIRLALRDLKNNKLRTLSFGLLLALTLGLLLPSLVTPRLNSIDWGAQNSMREAPGYQASSTPERQLVATFQGAGQTKGEILEAFPRASVFEELVIIPQVQVEFQDAANRDLGQWGMSMTSGRFDQAPLAQTVTILQGRTPTGPGEIAIDLEILAESPEAAAAFADMGIGETRVFDTRDGPLSLTLVGTLSSNLPLSLTHISPVVVAPGTFAIPGQESEEYEGWPGNSIGLAFGTTELEMAAALRIAESFAWRLEPFSFSVTSSSMENAQEYEFQMTRLLDSQPIYSSAYAKITLLVVLLFLTVLGVPMFTLSTQRRQEEMVQLRKAGASTLTLWGSLVASAFIVAGGAVVAGILVAFVMLRLRVPFLPLHMVYAGENIAMMVGVAVAGAFGTALVAASIPAFNTLRNTNQLSGAQPGTTGLLGSSRTSQPMRVKWVMLTLGAGVMVLISGLFSAGIGNYATSGLGILILGAIIILVGVYFLVPALLNRLVAATRSRSLSLRLAARELATRPATTVPAIVPVAFVSAFITIVGIISRQHYLEGFAYDGQPNTAYAMVFPVLWIPIAAAAGIVLLTLSATYLSLPQLQQDRTTLHNMGQPSSQIGRTEGVRAALMAGIGVVIGTSIGILLGLVILIFRYLTVGQHIPLHPGALWIWEVFLIAGILPVLTAYLGGRVMGGHTKSGRVPAIG